MLHIYNNANKCSTVAEIGERLATIDMGRKLEMCPLWGKLDPHVTQCAWAMAYLRTKWPLDPSSRLATINMAKKWGLGPHLAQCGLGRGLPVPPNQVAF